MSSKKFYFGAPWHTEDREEFEKAILERYSVEGAVNYISLIVDRQITKAIGLLTVNTILFAAFTNTNMHSTYNEIPLIVASLLVLISSFPLITIMYVAWGSKEEYQVAKQDFEGTCKIVYLRSYFLTFSLMLSFLALIFAIYFKSTRLVGTFC